MRFAPLIAAMALIAAPGLASTADTQALSADVKTLSAPAFEGRSPGTPGEGKTIKWLIERLKALGLRPGGPGGRWIQPVPLVHTRIDTAAAITIGGAKFMPGIDVNLTTVRASDRVTIVGAPLVFVGYGVSAPEAGWDDFKGVDLKGKVAVFLVNDPDFEAERGDSAWSRFGGRRMTYYGRWTYKFEEAARRGAIAALIVHDTGGAGYPWSTVNANQGENYDIIRGPDDPRIALQGWIGHDAADALFKRAGFDPGALRAKARQIDFRPVDMGVALDADLGVKVEQLQSANVLARLPGRKYADETVMFGAHWDAYGKAADGQSYRPGANDDALGVAGVLELARHFARGPRPDRSLVFALWTGEERGLLGSEYYASHPVYPIGTTVANMTLDILQTAGPAKDVILVGQGQSSLDSLLADAAGKQGRAVTPETFSERGLFFRADHFSLARRGVPALLIMALGGANDLKQGGREAGQAWLDSYMACYHKACDDWRPDWDLRGAAQDIDLFEAIGSRLANGREWPSWNPSNAFFATRSETSRLRH